MSESLADHLKNLDKDFLRELVDSFAILAEDYTGEARDVVRNISWDYYLEEALAADDPVRLAELDAIREERSLAYRLPDRDPRRDA